jgi:2-oxo-3-hexenedioate decarboxylase/2-keto-4-pentenoate hydratase
MRISIVHGEHAAAWIAARRLAGETLASMPGVLKPATEDEGYEVQAEVQARLIASGWGPLVGWKVGVTTPQMRAVLGLEAPIGGAVLAHGRQTDGDTIRYADYTRLGIECEMAFVLGAPLGGTDAAVDIDTARAAVAELHPAIELVDDRYGGDYRRFGVAAIVADDAFHAGFVLGPAVPDWDQLDLGALRGVTRANGEVKYEGYGRDVQGHPLASLAWMANRLTALGARIEAGDIVLTGSLPVVYWTAPGERVEIEIERLGSLHLNVT